MQEKVGIIGLGYVGLPVALAFAKKFPGTVGFDISERRVGSLRDGIDLTGELTSEELREIPLRYTNNAADLEGVTFFVVAVPTPVDENNRPDLTPMIRASETVGKVLKPGSVVVFESTVYPGVTEDVCGPVLEKVSGLKRGIDFKLGYSPERINPGDKERTFERIVKVVSAEDDESLARVSRAYAAVVPAGIFSAASIKAAEAAKVIENTQRDINIALMNELALLCDKMGIRTKDVLDAARTKWNFLPFSPGLVGGHCIGVDPYYLTHKAEELGYQPQVILSGRRINNSIGPYIGQKLVKLLAMTGSQIRGARVGFLGLTFKENVSDLRNSRVPDIIEELSEFGVEPMVHDAHAHAAEAEREYGVKLVGLEDLRNLDALVLAVPHQMYLDMPTEKLAGLVRKGGVVVDIKSVLDPKDLPGHLTYWSL